MVQLSWWHRRIVMVVDFVKFPLRTCCVSTPMYEKQWGKHAPASNWENPRKKFCCEICFSRSTQKPAIIQNKQPTLSLVYQGQNNLSNVWSSVFSLWVQQCIHPLVHLETFCRFSQRRKKVGYESSSLPSLFGPFIFKKNNRSGKNPNEDRGPAHPG